MAFAVLTIQAVVCAAATAATAAAATYLWVKVDLSLRRVIFPRILYLDQLELGLGSTQRNATPVVSPRPPSCGFCTAETILYVLPISVGRRRPAHPSGTSPSSQACSFPDFHDARTRLISGSEHSKSGVTAT